MQGRRAQPSESAGRKGSVSTNRETPQAAGAPRSGAFRGACARLRRSWGILAALALFLTVGLAVLDDYGVTTDEGYQRTLAIQNLDYVLRASSAFPQNHDKLYGVAFEAPLVLVERALGLKDSRAIYLSRHLLTHLFFLVGGFFAYLLALRLFRNRWLALLAALLFLLHPRLYAHSFFNSKDIPFLAAFVIALFLTHRAFGRGGVGSFALLGAAMGILVNLRIMGFVLLACVLLARLLDVGLASGKEERIRALAGVAAFALTAALTAYAALPFLWGTPISGFSEWWSVSSAFPNLTTQLFGGELFERGDTPIHFAPTWFLITTPPFALLLGFAGVAAVGGRGALRPGAALRNTRLRFGLILAACFAAPLLAVMNQGSVIYNGWRLLYFLWAPFSLLAVFGLRWLGAALIRLRLRAALYGAAAAGLAAAVAAMAAIHPHQQVSFNFLVDRVAPERLRTQYDFDYWGHPVREALETLLELHPVGQVPIEYGFQSLAAQSAIILPPDDRKRIVIGGDDPQYSLTNYRRFWGSGSLLPEAYAPVLRERKVYGSALFALTQFAVDERFADDYRADYEETAARPTARSEFDVRLADGALYFAQEPCNLDAARRLWFLHIRPVNEDDLPPARREWGFDNLDFFFAAHGVTLDGACIARVPLPAYDIDVVEIGQFVRGEGPIWEEELRVSERAAP